MNIEMRRDQLFIGMILIVCAFSYLFPDGANAYGWSECHGNKIVWNQGWTNMYISTTSFPEGSALDARIQNAMWHWNNVRGCGFAFYVGRDTDGEHRSGNGVNEIYTDDDLSDDELAVTFTRYHCYWFFGWRHGLDEADIDFNSNKIWNTGSLNYNNLGSPFSIESTALHELGHALGLEHEDRVLATLNSFYPFGGSLGHWKEWDPLGDDRAGARFLYPMIIVEIELDIAGSVFKRIGSGSSGLVSSPLTATRGSTVNIEFTFSNLSSGSVNFDIGFYLSTNDYISSFDLLLGTNSGAFAGSGGTGTFTRSLNIPTTVAPGTYYLGFIVDRLRNLNENDEDNNYMEMPRAIVIN